MSQHEFEKKVRMPVFILLELNVFDKTLDYANEMFFIFTKPSSMQLFFASKTENSSRG